MKKAVQITKEMLQEKFAKFNEQQKQIEKKVEELGILHNKLEGAKESLILLLEEFEENKSEEVKQDESKK